MNLSKYQTYCEYKNSEASWLGDVPESWQLSPLKYLTQFSGGGTPSKDKPEYWDGSIPWVSPKDMKTARITSTIDKITERAIEDSTTNLLIEGALLLVVRSGILQHSIPAAINDVPVTLNQDMKALRFNKRIHVKYAMYVVSGNQKSLLLEWGKQGATVESIEQEYLSNTIFPVPTATEQQKIVNFLDHETTQIDTLIEKQQQLIKLLKEKRQAVISHAVTKGLNSDAPLRDSSVEWLGAVPAHWITTKIKYIAELTPKKSELERTKFKVCNFIPMEKLKKDTLILDETRRIEEVIDGYTYFRDEDVLMAKVTPCFENKNMVVARDLVNGIGFGSSEIYVLRQRINLLNDFLCYRIQENVFIEIATGAMTGAGGLKRVPSDFLNNFEIALPPEHERAAIVEFLKLNTTKYDDLMGRAEGLIGLMQERRTALISAAVTGKIDVRSWQAPEPSSSNASEATA